MHWRTTSGWYSGLAALLLGCGGADSTTLNRLASVDTSVGSAREVQGDGATTFLSDVAPSPLPAAAQPFDTAHFRSSPGHTWRLQGDTLFVLSSLGTLSIIDAADPAALRVQASYSFRGQPLDFDVQGSRVYVFYEAHDAELGPALTDQVIEPDQHVAALDITDTAHIRLLDEADLNGSLDAYRLDRDFEAALRTSTEIRRAPPAA